MIRGVTLILIGSWLAAAGGAQAQLKAAFVRVHSSADGLTRYALGKTMLPAWGDYDNDGDLDFPLNRNEGDGTFTEMPGFRELFGGANFHGLAWGDYDADGFVDLVGLAYETGESVLLHNEGDGTFVNVAPALGLNIAGFGETAIWGDYDGDGDIDLFAPFYAHVAPFRSFLFRNNGDGTFTDVAVQAGVALQGIPQPLRPEGAHWADWDEDGDLDFYCAHHLFINDSRLGRFNDVRLSVGLPQLFDEGAMFVDVDNDGHLDLYIRTLNRGRLFRNTAGFLIEMTDEAGIPLGGAAWGDNWADVDNDGDLDLLYFREDESMLLMLNQGDGRLIEDPDFTQANFPRTLTSAWGDYDNDGDLDLLYGTHAQHLLQNQLQASAGFADSYLRIKVLDAQGRLTQHGSTVRVRRVDVASDRVQTRVVDGGSGYLTQSQYSVHFGVQPDGIYAIEVSFPSPWGEKIVVDATVVPELGAVSPRLLLNKEIKVFRDGRIEFDGVIRPPGARAEPDRWARYR